MIKVFSKRVKVGVLVVFACCFGILFLMRLDGISGIGRLTGYTEEEVRRFELRGKNFDEVRKLMGDPYDIMVSDGPDETIDWMYKNFRSKNREIPRYVIVIFKDNVVDVVFYNYK
jgi:hypothetical protein